MDAQYHAVGGAQLHGRPVTGPLEFDWPGFSFTLRVRQRDNPPPKVPFFI